MAALQIDPLALQIDGAGEFPRTQQPPALQVLPSQHTCPEPPQFVEVSSPLASASPLSGPVTSALPSVLPTPAASPLLPAVPLSVLSVADPHAPSVTPSTTMPPNLRNATRTVATMRPTVSATGRTGKSHAKTNPLDGIEGKGKRRHGKPQLRIDEARKWMAKAVELSDQGDEGAVAAMMALLLGMRASEITSRVVRDLDDDGRLLWIPDAKTEAGKRTLHVPDVLRPHLQALVAGQLPGGRLFGHHWRDWPREQVQRICELAGVPKVSAHGMRGLHSTLAMEAGVTGAVVAASLGHEKITTTIRSYAKAEAVAAAQQVRTLRVLAGGA
jgi:hypothetical protein